ncbi:hypothetical protein [Pseudomonas typographi]|uniref:hypothetical protein n=1 Tax=Pseudomonas typographi TaxID=2715964 RepID=UPI0016832B9F|nr:hypothetical protein [Pseudomonas typographi]MBD1552909.1 hypothetical protein [Pseudomonas typographi]
MPIDVNNPPTYSAALDLYASVKGCPRSNLLSRILKGVANSVRARKSTEFLVIKHRNLSHSLKELSNKLNKAHEERGRLVDLGNGHLQSIVINTVRNATPGKRPINISLGYIEPIQLDLQKKCVAALRDKKIGKLEENIGKYEKELQTIDNKINKRAIIKSER